VDDTAACRRLVQSLPLRRPERREGRKPLETTLTGPA
jgi:hypothetical protein